MATDEESVERRKDKYIIARLCQQHPRRTQVSLSGIVAFHLWALATTTLLLAEATHARSNKAISDNSSENVGARSQIS